MKKIIITRIFFLFLLFNVGFGFNAKAQNASDIMIAPHTFEFNVKRGEGLENRIKILNKGLLQMPFKVKTIDFTAEDETGKMIFEGSDDISPAKWIDIKNVDFILGPGETKIVNFSIDIPQDIDAGGYYATIVFEPQLPSIYFEKDKPRAIPEIGALILFAVEIKGVEREAGVISVAKFRIPEKYHLEKVENIVGEIIGVPKEAIASEKGGFSVVENSKLSFDVQIKNEDIFHNRFLGKLEVISNDGKKVLGETEVSRITILPGRSRTFPVEFTPDSLKGFLGNLPLGISAYIKENFMWGKYKAKLTLFQENPAGLPVSSARENNITEKIIEFWIFPWKTAIMIFVLAVAILLMKKRIIMAGKALFKPLNS